ncbi:MAG: preprotein translocase subunit SecG [Candidatus Pacebacteria bacterium]|nr:preprotein translocase subunit SecG [Candidatus Paceibacterota bacterium]
MQNVFLVLQIFLAVVITVFILLQAQGSGLGSTWGGGGETFHTRRGVEKLIFTLTIVAIILFAAVSIASLM